MNTWLLCIDKNWLSVSGGLDGGLDYCLCDLPIEQEVPALFDAVVLVDKEQPDKVIGVAVIECFRKTQARPGFQEAWIALCPRSKCRDHRLTKKIGMLNKDKSGQTPPGTILKLSKRVGDSFHKRFVTGAKRLALKLQAILEAIPEPFVASARSVKEGKKRLTTHMRRERASNLSKSKKLQDYAENQGRLICGACGISSKALHIDPEVGLKSFEAHHTKPLSRSKGERITSLRDLTIVCANCHRMIHSKWPPFAVGDLHQGKTR